MVAADLEMAIAHLKRAWELSQLRRDLTEEQRKKIDLIKRATANVRKEVGRA